MRWMRERMRSERQAAGLSSALIVLSTFTIRTAECRLQLGGNASNSSAVLSLLGIKPDYLGTLASGPFFPFIIEHFKKYKIGIHHATVYEGYDCPLSTILINKKNGSRTILHSNKNLPEPNIKDFEKVNLQDYTWVHFEGRNAVEVKKMINHVNNYNEKTEYGKITISVELEKAKEGIIDLAAKADVVFVSKEFSMHHEWNDADTACMNIKKFVKESAMVICAWGEDGAVIMTTNGTFRSPAYPPRRVVDTLGAGDTFNAAAISALMRGLGPEEAVSFACRVAGFKVGIYGFDGIEEYDSVRESKF